MSKVVVTRNRKLNAVEKNRSPISKTTAGVTFTTKREDHEADLILVYKLSDSLNRPKRETFKEYFEKILQLVVKEVFYAFDTLFAFIPSFPHKILFRSRIIPSSVLFVSTRQSNVCKMQPKRFVSAKFYQ